MIKKYWKYLQIKKSFSPSVQSFLRINICLLLSHEFPYWSTFYCEDADKTLFASSTDESGSSQQMDWYQTPKDEDDEDVLKLIDYFCRL